MTEKRFKIKLETTKRIEKILSDFQDSLGIKSQTQAIRTLIYLSPKIDKVEILEIETSTEEPCEISYFALKNEIKSIDAFKKRFSFETRTKALEFIILSAPKISIYYEGDSLAKKTPKIKEGVKA